MNRNSIRTMTLALGLALVFVTIQSAHAQTFTTLYSFNDIYSGQLQAGLIQATNGDLYGTTYDSGSYLAVNRS